MPHLGDVNLLLALLYSGHDHHPAAKAWLDPKDPDAVVVCRITQLSVLRLLTNKTVMAADVCTQAKAWQVFEKMMGDDRFSFEHEPPGLDSSFRALTSGAMIAPLLWQDAYLAAFALSGKLTLSTFDSGFRRFPGLALELLKS